MNLKTDLHLHGLLSAPLGIYEKIAGRALPKLPQSFDSFEAFNQYLFQNLIFTIQNLDHVREVVRAAFERLIDDGVVYAEVSFDVMIPELVKSSSKNSQDFFEILNEEKKRVSSQINIGLEIGLSRKMPVDVLFPKVKEWVGSGYFTSIDLYDDERCGVLSDLVPLYRFCGEKGLKLKAHVGEFGPAHTIKDYVETLNLHAVQHGIRAVDNARVMDFLAKKGTLLNLCPTSNVALGACASYEFHPAKKLFDAGIKITINTDDFALFGASLKDEYEHLTEMGFSVKEIKQLALNGLSEKPLKRN